MIHRRGCPCLQARLRSVGFGRDVGEAASAGPGGSDDDCRRDGGPSPVRQGGCAEDQAGDETAAWRVGQRHGASPSVGGRDDLAWRDVLQDYRFTRRVRRRDVDGCLGWKGRLFLRLVSDDSIRGSVM